MKKTCDFSGFTFTGTDGKTYGYDANGAPCTTSGVSATNIADVSADRWGRIANTPISTPSMMPQPPMIQNDIMQPIGMNTPSFQPMPNISLSQPTNVSVTSLSQLPRVATENEFVATCHGNIVVDSIIDHAITRNSQGHGANALASLKLLNLSHNYLSDSDIQKLNNGLYGYTLNLQSFNISNNSMGVVGLDHLIKGSIGIAHLQAGGNDINNMMQGILTLPTTSIVCLNLANNNIGDIGADILGHALVNGKLPATKNIDVSGNNITDVGHKKLIEGMESPNSSAKGLMITLVQNIVDINNTIDKALKSTVDFVTKGLKYTIEQHNKEMKGTKWDGTTVRTDSLDKWKNCKEVGQNVQKGFIGGLIKCGPLIENPPAMFICIGKDIGMELLDPDTIWCAVEVNEFVKETEVMGDCTIF